MYCNSCQAHKALTHGDETMINLNAKADAKYTKAHSGALITFGECRYFAGDHAGTKRYAKRQLRKARRAAERRLCRQDFDASFDTSYHDYVLMVINNTNPAFDSFDL